MSGRLHILAAVPQEKGLGAYWIEGSIGPRVSLDDLGREKISCMHQELNHNFLATQPIAHSMY